MSEQNSFSRENEFSQLMARVNALLDADDGDDEKSLNFDAVYVLFGRKGKLMCEDVWCSSYEINTASQLPVAFACIYFGFIV